MKINQKVLIKFSNSNSLVGIIKSYQVIDNYEIYEVFSRKVNHTFTCHKNVLIPFKHIKKRKSNV